MKSKVLFTVTDINLIENLKGMGIQNFVYPLSFFCVGIPKTFNIDEIKEDNAYILINRVLDTKSVDKLKNILYSLPSNIKGIIFDDLSLINILKDLNVKKILFNFHFNTNYMSINYMFEYVDEIIVSTDITEKEIDEIISKTNKKVSLFAFGLVSACYSRRELLNNHSKHYNIDYSNKKNLNIKDKKFIAVENEYGTVLYHYPYFNGKRLLEKDVNYLLYFPILLDNDRIVEILSNNFSNVLFDEGFLDTKTIYKVRMDNNG